MEIKKYIRQYRDAKRQGRTEEARELKFKMEMGGRGVVSRYTQGRPWLARPTAAVVRLTESKTCKQTLASVIKAYETEDKPMSKRRLRRVKRDIYRTEFLNRISADEYFRYQFENLSKYGRRTYVGDVELVETFSRLDDPEEKKILADKYNTYCFYRPYYHRDAILVNGEEERELLKEFCARHPSFFIKPLSKCGGHGVRRVEPEREGGVGKLLETVMAEAPFIVEEPIRQAEEMACFHPQSINTIRVVTTRIDGKIEIIQTSVRLGTGDSVVDNGCLSSAVDPALGVITSPGRAAHSAGLYIFHPDTGEQILGRKIPAWTELLTLVKGLADQLKKQRIIGWDMAYSVDGWVVVEANTHPAIQILAGNGVGMRSVFEKMIR